MKSKRIKLLLRFCALLLALWIPTQQATLGSVYYAVASAGGGGPVTDNFNRADGALGANWTIGLGANMAIVSNQVTTTVSTTDQFAYYAGGTFTDNQYAKVQIIATVASNIAAARCSGSGGTFSCYWVRNDGIHKFVNGAYSLLLSDSAGALAVNGVLEIRVTGTTIERYVDGVLDGSVTDASLSSGRPGIGQYKDGANPTLDNFEGGNL